MPYAKNGDINIYYEVEGEGPSLVLLHGGSGESSIWRDYGYVEPLKNDCTLVLIDARGHGNSDKPHEVTAYNMNQRVTDVIAVLDEVGVKTASFYGYSYGGRIALELAKFVPEKVSSAIISGMGPWGKSKDGSNPVLTLLEAGPDATLSALERSGPLSEKMKARVLATDFDAVIAVLKSDWPDLSEYLPNMFMPFLIINGEADQVWSYLEVKEGYSVLPDMKFISLPDLDHSQCWQRSDIVVPHIKEFLARVNK